MGMVVLPKVEKLSTQQSGANRSAMPVVLFQASGMTYRGVREWLPVAHELNGKGYQSVFIVDESCPGEWLEKCREVGARYRIAPGSTAKRVTASPEVSTPVAHKALEFIKRATRRIPLSAWLGTWLALRREIGKATELIAQERPRAIVVGSDSFQFTSAALVKVANRAFIPTLVCHLSTSLPAKAALEHRRASVRFVQDHSLKPLPNRMFARIAPRWVHEFYGTRMFFHPIRVNVMAWLLGLLPRYPYSGAGGYATVVASISERDKQAMLEEGIPAEKIVVTGLPSFDGFLQHVNKGPALRSQVLQSLGIGSHEKILLFNVLHRAEHGLWPWEDQLREVGFLLETFTSLPVVRVIMSLHPHPRQAEFYDVYEPLAKRYGAVIARKHDIVELVAVCDLFVSERSTTLQLSVGAHKPTILLYYYNDVYRTAEFDRAVAKAYEAGGIAIVWKREELLPLFQRLVTDHEFYDSFVQAQADVAPEWMMLDGKCTDRVVGQITSLIERNGCLSPKM